MRRYGVSISKYHINLNKYINKCDNLLSRLKILKYNDHKKKKVDDLIFKPSYFDACM